MMQCHFDQLGNSSVFTHSFNSVALSKASLQANRETFRNGSAETKNGLVEIKYELRTFLVSFQFKCPMKRSMLACIIKLFNVKS